MLFAQCQGRSSLNSHFYSSSSLPSMSAAIFMANIEIFLVSLSSSDRHPNRATYFLVIMWIEVGNHSNASVWWWRIRLNILITSLCFGVIMNLVNSISFMVFMINVNEESIFDNGNLYVIHLISFLLLQWLARGFFAYMEVWVRL